MTNGAKRFAPFGEALRLEKGLFYSFNEAVEKVFSSAHPAVNQTGYQVS
jgi:hypothetical protein